MRATLSTQVSQFPTTEAHALFDPPQQVEKAEKVLDAITRARINHAVKKIEDRTTFLNTLTSQLEAVKNSVEPNPIGNVLGKITGAVAAINTALAQGN